MQACFGCNFRPIWWRREWTSWRGSRFWWACLPLEITLGNICPGLFVQPPLHLYFRYVVWALLISLSREICVGVADFLSQDADRCGRVRIRREGKCLLYIHTHIHAPVQLKTFTITCPCRFTLTPFGIFFSWFILSYPSTRPLSLTPQNNPTASLVKSAVLAHWRKLWRQSHPPLPAVPALAMRPPNAERQQRGSEGLPAQWAQPSWKEIATGGRRTWQTEGTHSAPAPWVLFSREGQLPVWWTAPWVQMKRCLRSDLLGWHLEEFGLVSKRRSFLKSMG